ncbi:hypothetical protein OM427_19300 [Halomonas sp. 18H]|nr:hypothetical protein [Halomonas sp. 18H]MCW4151671.1 hypothetical protein [Halomonas sp. 18H]
MATPGADSQRTAVHARPRRPRGVPGRWWLAGLLVGCLLPAGLAQAEWRATERVVQMCILAPAVMRASSQLRARRRAVFRWPSRPAGDDDDTPSALPHQPRAPLCSVAAHDVLTRRGPPGALLA